MSKHLFPDLCTFFLPETEEPALMENKDKQSTLQKLMDGITRLWAVAERHQDQLHLLATNTKKAFLEKAKLRNVSNKEKEN